MAIGSDQSDARNEFNWTVTKVDLEEHERLQGAFGNVKSLNGMIRLRTIGFFKSDCLYEKPEEKKTSYNPSKPAT